MSSWGSFEQLYCCLFIHFDLLLTYYIAVKSWHPRNFLISVASEKFQKESTFGKLKWPYELVEMRGIEPRSKQCFKKLSTIKTYECNVNKKPRTGKHRAGKVSYDNR